MHSFHLHVAVSLLLAVGAFALSPVPAKPFLQAAPRVAAAVAQKSTTMPAALQRRVNRVMASYSAPHS